MDDYKYVIVVENIEVVVINVKKLIIKGLAIQKQEKMVLTITSAHKKSVNLHKDTIINVIDCQEHHELCKKTNPINIICSFYRLIPRPPLPTCREDISLPDAFIKTDRGGIFHIYSTADNSIMIFASLEMLRVLAECIIWHADGTFHVAPKFFQQLYLIYGWLHMVG